MSVRLAAVLTAGLVLSSGVAHAAPAPTAHQWPAFGQHSAEEVTLASEVGVLRPAAAASGWLAGELVDGQRIVGSFEGEQFDDVGLTIDVVLALASGGVGADAAEPVLDWLEEQAGSYTGPAFGGVFAGATAKLALAMVVADRDPRAAGGLDLISQLEQREQADGRYTDESEFGDFSSTLTQALGVLALARTPDANPSDAAVAFLLDQACDDGGFRFDPAEDGCTATVDTTAIVMQALSAVGGEQAAAALEAAADWLTEVQQPDGGFDGGFGVNANSTGLAATALAIAARPDAVRDARGFLVDLQASCGDGEPGAIRFDAADGGNVDRATSQAIPGLTGIGLDTVRLATADAELPSLSCEGANPDCILRFDDVAIGSTHAAAICVLAEREVIGGIAPTLFDPQGPVTRAQTASLVSRALGLEATTEVDFPDVPDDNVHAPGIAAAVEAGILAGRVDGTFGPGLALRRDQMASMLARAADLDGVDDARFMDVADDNVHREAINAVAQAGITAGVTDTTFAPALEVTRAQLATFLLRTTAVIDGG